MHNRDSEQESTVLKIEKFISKYKKITQALPDYTKLFKFILMKFNYFSLITVSLNGIKGNKTNLKINLFIVKIL